MNSTERTVSIFETDILERHVYLTYWVQESKDVKKHDRHTKEWSLPAKETSNLTKNGISLQEHNILNDDNANALITVEFTTQEHTIYPLLAGYSVPGFDSNQFHDNERLQAVRLRKIWNDTPVKLEGEQPSKNSGDSYHQRLKVQATIELIARNGSETRGISVNGVVVLTLPSGHMTIEN